MGKLIEYVVNCTHFFQWSEDSNYLNRISEAKERLNKDASAYGSRPSDAESSSSRASSVASDFGDDFDESKFIKLQKGFFKGKNGINNANKPYLIALCRRTPGLEYYADQDNTRANMIAALQEWVGFSQLPILYP